MDSRRELELELAPGAGSYRVQCLARGWRRTRAALWILPAPGRAVGSVGLREVLVRRLDCTAIHRLHNAVPSSAGSLPESLILERKELVPLVVPLSRAVRSHRAAQKRVRLVVAADPVAMCPNSGRHAQRPDLGL